jgi:hypothetical protein
MMFSSSAPEDLSKTEKWLLGQSNAVLIRIIAAPSGNALLDRLPGFTASHLKTAEAHVVVELAKAELKSREEVRRLDARKARRPALLSVGLAAVVFVISGGGLIAWSTIRSFAATAWSMVR